MRQHKKSRLSGLIIPFFSAALLAYFAYHAQTGRYGIQAMREMDLTATQLAYELDEIRMQHRALEQKVSLLTAGTLEADALDENARQILGLTGKDEIVILY